MLLVTYRNQDFFYIFISNARDTLTHMYVKIFLKGSVGLFQKHFASISETQLQKELCVVIKIFKKTRMNELENYDEAKRKARNYINFLKGIY